jgi:NADH dehydrogenase
MPHTAGLLHNSAIKFHHDHTYTNRRLLKMFELAAQESDADKRRALLTFVVVGGGPTGVESAGALSELIRLVLTKDYRGMNFKEARVILLEATDKLLSALTEQLREAAAEALWNKKVEVRFGAAVADFDGQRVSLKGGEIVPAHTLIWAAGVKAASLVDTLGVKQGRLGRVVVTPALQLPDHPEAFVIGDAAYLESDGQPLPMVAPVAIQQADVAATNIKRMLAGQPPVEFVYKDPGSLATIGRNQAVAQLGKLQFRGFIAWVLWLVVHIIQLIGFRNRLVVLINWAWDYLFYDRAVRLISPE